MAVVAGPVALAAAGADDDAPDAATFTCVTGPLSPGLPIRTLTLTLVGDDCTDVTGAGAVVRAAGAIPPAVSTETVVVSGAAGSVCGVDMAPGAVSAAGAAAGTAADVSSAGVGSPVACASPPSASATALSTAALASSTSTAPGSTDGTAAGDWGTEAKPSSARASAGRVAAAAPTSVAATTHVARRTVVIGAMHRHLCNHVDVFIHHFFFLSLDIGQPTRYFGPDKGRWIGWRIGGNTVRDSGNAQRLRFSPPTTAGATEPLERG